MFALDPESYLEWFIFKNGYYEREVLDAALRHLPEHGVFWDVGANIGLHALTIKRLRPDVSVYAFEPVPFTAARFLLNQSLARAEVELFPIAGVRKNQYEIWWQLGPIVTQSVAQCII